MARYRWVGTHAYRDHRNDRVIETDEEIGDDADRIAEAHPHDVERIDEESNENPTGDAPDVDEWANWNEDDWMDLDYKQRAEDVQEGRVDEHLEEIAEVETSDTVEEAVDERLNELES